MAQINDGNAPDFVVNWSIPATGTNLPVGAGSQPAFAQEFSVATLAGKTGVSLTFDIATGSTAIGTFGIQVSDFGTAERPGYDVGTKATTFPWSPLYPPNTVTGAITVPIVSGAQTINLQLPNLSAKFLRLVYTATSGTGTVNVAMTFRAVMT